jgi:hypothetical protein
VAGASGGGAGVSWEKAISPLIQTIAGTKEQDGKNTRMGREISESGNKIQIFSCAR